MRKKITSDRKLYGNYEIYHPDGFLMCFCNIKRFNWYLNKNLAIKINDKQIKLLFEPNGPGDPMVILEPRQDICVVSGLTDNLSKHHVVPYQYRKLFPLRYKNKNSTDVVLLERQIHNEYELYADIFKERLEDDFGDIKWKEINYAWIEAKIKHKIITSEYYHLLAPQIQVFHQMRYEGLIEKYNIDIESFNDKTSPYILENSKEMINNIGVENLIVLWKLHFIKYANPQYLPDWWKPNLVKTIKGDTDLESTFKIIDLNEPFLKSLIKKYDLDI